MHLIHRLLIIVIGLGIVLPAQAQNKKKSAKMKITYDDHIKPLFRAKCFTCHNPDKKSADLDLTNYATVMAGGSSGEVVEAGDLESSYLWSLVNHAEQPFMPPKQDKLDKKSLDLIGAWINGGALENRGSKFVRTKPMVNLKLKVTPGARPKVIPFPKRLSLQPPVTTKLTTAVTAMATSPWAPLAAVAGQKQVLLYNTKTLQLVGTLPFPEGIANVLQFSRSGKLLLAGGGRAAFRGLVVVWDIETGKRVFEVGDEVNAVMGADISADQSMIVIGSSPKVVRVYSTSDGTVSYQIAKKHTDWIKACSFSPDGVLLATADRAGGLFVWEADTGREYLRLAGHGGGITGLSWRTDSNILASCGLDGRIKLWEMENGRLVKNWSAHGGGVQSVEFCRDGNLVSCGRDKLARLWNQNGGKIRDFGGFAEMALSVTYCDETKRIFAGDWTGDIKSWTATDGKVLTPISINPPKLESRLAAAAAALPSRKQAAEKAAATYRAAKAKADKVNGDLATAKKAVPELQSRGKAIAAAMKKANLDVTKLMAQQTTATKKAAALEPVVVSLKTTLSGAQQTAAKAVGDKQIAALVQQFKSLTDERAADLVAAKKAAADTKTAIAKTKTLLVAQQKEAKQVAVAAVAMQKKVTDLGKAVKPANDKTAAAKTAFDLATQTLLATQKAIERWKSELEFVAKLDNLTVRESEFQTLSATATTATQAVNQVKAEVARLAKVVVATREKHKTALAAAAKTKATVGALATKHSQLKKTADALQVAIPLLKEATTKAQEAAKASGDKELIALANQVKATHAKKVTGLPAAQKLVNDAAGVLQKSQQQLAAEEKAAAGMAGDMAAAEKKIGEHMTAMKPLETKAATAKTAADAANKTFLAAQKEVDQLRDKTGAP